MKFTVIIPTRNPHRGRLSRTLAALARQSLPASEWELILVDNGSTPPLGPELLAGFPSPARLLREEKLGATSARLTGINASEGTDFVFVDDDNELAPGYLTVAADFLASHPGVAAIGGRIIGEFDQPPAPWVQPHSGLLALRDFGGEPIVSRPGADDETFPWFAPFGAGLVMRGDGVRHYRAWCASTAFFNCRTEGRLGGCGDTEMVIVGALRKGGGVAYVPELLLVHMIPSHRLAFRYLCRLAFSCGVDWGRLAVSQGYLRAVSLAGALLRIPRLFFLRRAWTRSGWIHVCGDAGRCLGRATWSQRT